MLRNYQTKKMRDQFQTIKGEYPCPFLLKNVHIRLSQLFSQIFIVTCLITNCGCETISRALRIADTIFITKFQKFFLIVKEKTEWRAACMSRYNIIHILATSRKIVTFKVIQKKTFIF